MMISDPLIAEFIDSLSGASQKTRNLYHTGLHAFQRTAIEIDTGCIAAYDVYLSKTKYAKMTRLMYVQSLIRFVQWLDVNDRLPGFNLTKATLQLRLARGRDHTPAYTPREADPDMPLVVDYYDELELPPCTPDMVPIERRQRLELLRNRALMHTFLATGARLSEILSLTRAGCQDGKRNEVRIVGKGGFSRLIFLSPTAQSRIATYCAERDDTHPELWITWSGKALQQTGVWRIFKEAAHAKGMSAKTSPHGFRHYVAWDMLNNRGVPLDMVQAFLGHKNIATTRKVYATTADANLRRMVARYHTTSDPLGAKQMSLWGRDG
jgi:integrase